MIDSTISVEELRSMELDFIVHPNSPFLHRDSEVAVEISKGIKNAILAKAYYVSTTTILNAYYRTCRNILKTLHHNENFDKGFVDELHRSVFNSAHGAALIENYRGYILKGNYKKPSPKWLLLTDEKKDVITEINNKMLLMAHNYEKRKNTRIKNMEKEYESFKKNIISLLSEINKLRDGMSNG